MINIGVIGLGFMGRTHLEIYERLAQEGFPIRVIAICDIDEGKLAGQGKAGNIDTAATLNLERYAKYTSITEMLESEKLDCVSIALPTYLHKDATIQCLEHRLHVLCEKPMAMNAKECSEMLAAAHANNKQLMVGQCLRFWPAYEYLKEVVDSGQYGKVLSGHFFRGGGTPSWSPWLTQKEKSGGALLDMHVHDTDLINWLFGKPCSVSCVAVNVVEGSGYDIASTHYAYEDGIILNAQVDWTLQGDFGFEMSYRVNFEQGNLVFQGGELKVNPNGGSGFTPQLSKDLGYYYELKYFIESLIQGTSISIADPESTMTSIKIMEAEALSADQQGAWVEIA